MEGEVVVTPKLKKSTIDRSTITHLVVEVFDNGECMTEDQITRLLGDRDGLIANPTISEQS